MNPTPVQESSQDEWLARQGRSDADCPFCGIVNRTIPAAIVGETDGLLAFMDVHPQAPTHLVIIPTAHIPTLADVPPTQPALMGSLVAFANRLARDHQLTPAGYRLVINCGAQAGQSVWHLHAHLLGGRPFQWPPG